MEYHCLAPAAEQYVERMGLLWEDEGLPRIAGRILGFLALQPDAVTLDDIASTLGVSKASVSNDARRLQRLGLVERDSRPGDRRDYYIIAGDMPARVAARKLADLERLHAAMSEARDLPGTPPTVRARLHAFGQFQKQIIHQMHCLLASLEDQGTGQAQEPLPEHS